MAIDILDESDASRRGWFTRWFGGRSLRRSRPIRAAENSASRSVRPLISQLISQDRYVFALLGAVDEQIEAEEFKLAWTTIERRMAMVPAGRVPVVRADGQEALAEVEAFYLDRHPVTNRQYARFVEAGCYDDLEIWPREIWPTLLRWTDRTGSPGPAGWSHGRYPSGRDDHPVTRVGWHEAQAYARWVGKRLPRAVEWQKAGGWPEHLGGGSCTRYPWGDLFDPKRANIWASGIRDTVAVTEFSAGDTPNAIHQMSGNVWEWLEDPLDAIPCLPGETFHPWRPMRRIVGGGYDTYLPAEATCHFITGQPELDRRPNIGFRCAISVERIRAAC